MLLTFVFYAQLIFAIVLLFQIPRWFRTLERTEFARRSLITLAVIFPLPIFPGVPFAFVFFLAGVLLTGILLVVSNEYRPQIALGMVMVLLLGAAIVEGYESSWAFLLKTLLIAIGITGGYQAYLDWELGDREAFGWHILGVVAYFGGWSFLGVGTPAGVIRWGVLAILSGGVALSQGRAFRWVHLTSILVMVLWVIGAGIVG